MIGFQDYIITNNISVLDLSKELEISPTTIWRWFNINRVSNKFVNILANKYNLTNDYINKKVNDTNTYKPRCSNDYKIVDNYAIIYLNRKNGEVFETYIDLEDLDRVMNYGHKWYPKYYPTSNAWYAICTLYVHKNSYTTMFLHRFIMNDPKDDVIDHIESKNTLDNRKNNLRNIPKINNETNRKGKNKNNKSGYRNVFWNSQHEQWCVTLSKNNNRIMIGYFDDVHEAGKTAEEARQKYYGEEFAGNN